MEKYYTLNEVALMSGLTTRTLRNHITIGVLKGEKINGIWRFSVEELEEFFQNPYVKPSIQAKKKSIVFDFLELVYNQTIEELNKAFSDYVQLFDVDEVLEQRMKKLAND